MRLLCLLPFPPGPDAEHGVARITGQLLESLAGRHEVAALYLRAAGEPPIARALRDRLALAEEVERPAPQAGPRRTLWLARRPLGLVAGRPAWATDWAVPAFTDRMQAVARAWRPDVVQAELHVMGQYLPGLADRSARRVLVEYEPGAAAAADLVAWERGLRRLGRRLDCLAWRRYERRVLAAADAVVALTEEDRRALAALAPGARVVRIAPGAALPPEPLDPLGAEPPRVLFVGNFVHPPNVEAAVRLGRAIFPPVRARRSDVRLEIVGDGPPAEVRGLAGDGVAVTGRVDDVRPYLDRAAVVTAPLRLGRGMRVKVIESLAAGKALVATRRALAGIDVASGEQVLVAESDRETRDALLLLLEDPERRRRLAGAARAWADEHLRWENAVAAYGSLYDSLLAPGRTAR